jgi:hypothetical protein
MPFNSCGLNIKHNEKRSTEYGPSRLAQCRKRFTILTTRNSTPLSNFGKVAERIIVAKENTNGLERHTRGALNERSVRASVPRRRGNKPAGASLSDKR